MDLFTVSLDELFALLDALTQYTNNAKKLSDAEREALDPQHAARLLAAERLMSKIEDRLGVEAPQPPDCD